MPSTATTRLRLEKQGIGENLSTWGDRLNTVLDLADEAIAGVEPITVSTANVTLTSTNYVSDQARNMALVLTGTLDANRTVTAPAVEKLYLIVNNCVQGAFTLTLKTASGSGYALRPGPQWVYCDGADFARAMPRLDELPLATQNVDINSKRLTNLGSPTASTDAATKGYIDTPAADRTMNGFKLTNVGSPTADADAATKLYVDGFVATAQAWASQTSAAVSGGEWSAKAHAIGGTGGPSGGAAKDWATGTAGLVGGSDYSAKEYAIGSQASTGGSAKNWAQQSGGVSGAAAGSFSAKDWAVKSGSTVDGTYYSARYYALSAATSEANAAGSATSAAGSATAAANAVANTNSIWCGTATGTANALVLTPTPALAAYAAGVTLRFVAAVAPTGAATVNVSGRGLRSLKTSTGGPITANAWAAGEILEFTDTGTELRRGGGGSVSGAQVHAALFSY